MKDFWRAAVIGGVLLGFGGFLSTPGYAMSSNVRAVLVTGAYGMVGGTVLGAVSFPFSQNLRTIFMGTSIGLYLGLAVGGYFISNRYDTNNPLHHPPPGTPPWQQPSRTPKEDEKIYYDLKSGAWDPKLSDQAWFAMEWPVFRF